MIAISEVWVIVHNMIIATNDEVPEDGYGILTDAIVETEMYNALQTSILSSLQQEVHMDTVQAERTNKMFFTAQ